jgi:hypothetical protein
LDNALGFFTPQLQSLGRREAQTLIKGLRVNTGISWPSVYRQVLTEQENQLS